MSLARSRVGEFLSDTSFARAFRPSLSPIDRVRLVSDMLHGRCTSRAFLGGTNSCGLVHGNSCGDVHANLCGVDAHRNSCVGANVHSGALQTKALGRCSLIGVWCLAVDTVRGERPSHSILRPAPEGTQVEAWEGRIFTHVPKMWFADVRRGV